MNNFENPIPKRPPAIPSAPVEKLEAAAPALLDDRSTVEEREQAPRSPVWQRHSMPTSDREPGTQGQLPLPTVRHSLGQALAESNARANGDVEEKQGEGDAGDVGGGGGPSVAHVQPISNADGIGALSDTDRKAQSRDSRFDSPVDSVLETQAPNHGASTAKPQGGMSLGQKLAEIKTQPKPDKPEAEILRRPGRRM